MSDSDSHFMISALQSYKLATLCGTGIKDRYKDQWNKTEIPETNSYINSRF